MELACFWVNSLYLETQAHLKQVPALSYAKGKVSGSVSLGTDKFFLLVVFLLSGMVNLSAQVQSKETKNRFSKTMKRNFDTVMSGVKKNFRSEQVFVKHDTVTVLKVSIVYLPRLDSIEHKSESFWEIVKSALPTGLVRLIIDGIIFYFLTLIWKQLKFCFHLLRRWRRRKRNKQFFI